MPSVLFPDSRRGSAKIVLCCFPARANSTATVDDSRHQLMIPGNAGILWSKEHGYSVYCLRLHFSTLPALPSDTGPQLFPGCHIGSSCALCFIMLSPSSVCARSLMVGYDNSGHSGSSQSDSYTVIPHNIHRNPVRKTPEPDTKITVSCLSLPSPMPEKYGRGRRQRGRCRLCCCRL